MNRTIFQDIRGLGKDRRFAMAEKAAHRRKAEEMIWVDGDERGLSAMIGVGYPSRSDRKS